MKIKDRMEALKRTYPNISRRHARFLYGRPGDMSRRSKKITVWMVLWSEDGRVSLHKTGFEKKRPMSVAEWSGWLVVNAPDVFKDSVLAYVNRTFGSSWNIERVIGWHFTTRGRS